MDSEKQPATEKEFDDYTFQKIKELGFEDAIGFSYFNDFREKEKSKRERNYPTYYKINGEVHCDF
ncbi:MAG: hypothetical protein WC511_01175 [Candidatus Pacearchaeota archaeon]|jgi:hypothetical protein